MRNIIGETIRGRYRVDDLIGEGGMSRVYKVWDNKMAVFLAMKVLRDDLAEDKVFLRRFKREAHTLAELQHPHIVHFYRLEDDGDLVFMFMDMVEGQTLRKMISQSDEPFSFDRVLEIMNPVCSAMHYAHQKGMVHCDIKPANIMIHRNGTILVTDFGIARQAEGATTSTMVGAGTPAYMAPEQVKGDAPTPQTDIYALGVVLFEMLTGGERPFTGEKATINGTTGEKVRWEQVNLKPGSPRRFNPQISPELEAVVLKCLEKDIQLRYSGVLELLDALQNVLGASVKTDETDEVETQDSPVKSQKEKQSKSSPPETVTRRKISWLIFAGAVSFITLLLFFIIKPLNEIKPQPATIIPTPVPAIQAEYSNASNPLRNIAIQAATIKPTPISDLATITPTFFPSAMYTQTPEKMVKSTCSFYNHYFSSFCNSYIRGDWIYYTDMRGILYKMRLDGSQNQQICDQVGLFLFYKDWIFFSKGDDIHHYALFKMHLDGSGQEIVNTIRVQPNNIDIYRDWIYFLDSEYLLNRMNLDGSGVIKLSKDSIGSTTISGDWIYFTAGHDVFNSKITRMHLDGSDRTVINSQRSQEITILGEWIYFINQENGSHIYRMHLDGTEIQELNNDQSSNLIIHDNIVFFVNERTGGKIFMMQLDGSGETQINDVKSYLMGVVGNWIYFENQNDSSKLYRIQLNGTGQSKVSEKKSYIRYMIGDWIFFTYPGSKQLHRMHLDGSGLEPVS